MGKARRLGWTAGFTFTANSAERSEPGCMNDSYLVTYWNGAWPERERQNENEFPNALGARRELRQRGYQRVGGMPLYER